MQFRPYTYFRQSQLCCLTTMTFALTVGRCRMTMSFPGATQRLEYCSSHALRAEQVEEDGDITAEQKHQFFKYG